MKHKRRTSPRSAGNMITRIIIEPTTLGQRGQRYRVRHDGRVLLESARDPLFEACRALIAAGITGRLEMWRPGKSHYDIATDIDAGARLTVVETATRGPVVAQWERWEGEASEQAFPVQASEQGVASRDLSVGGRPQKIRASTARCAT